MTNSVFVENYLQVSGPEGVRRNALRVLLPNYPHSEEVEQYIEQITRTSVGFLWPFCGLLQVDCRLRDHFATTRAYLEPICALSVAIVFTPYLSPPRIVCLLYHKHRTLCHNL